MKKYIKRHVTHFKISFEKRRKHTQRKNYIKENKVNSKKLWKTLKRLDLPEKRQPCTDVCLKAEEELKFDPTQSLNYLKNSIPISQMIQSKSSMRQLEI